MKSNPLIPLISMMAMNDINAHYRSNQRGRAPSKKELGRPCLECGVLHRHNNSYCSADCCKAHRVKAKPVNKKVSFVCRKCRARFEVKQPVAQEKPKPCRWCDPRRNLTGE